MLFLYVVNLIETGLMFVVYFDNIKKRQNLNPFKNHFIKDKTTLLFKNKALSLIK